MLLLSKKSTAFFGNVQILNEIKGTTNDGVEYDWHDDEIERLIDQIDKAWSHDKDLLLSEERQFGISAKDEYGSRFIDIGKIIIGVIAPHIDKVNHNSATKLKAIIDEFAQFGLPDYSIKKAFPLWYGSEGINEEFLKLASSSDEHKYADLLASVIRQVRCGCDVSNEIDVIYDNNTIFLINLDIAVCSSLSISFVLIPAWSASSSIKKFCPLSLEGFK